MKKKNDTSNFLILLYEFIPFAIFLSSCKPRDKDLWGFGAYLFFIYSVALVIVLTLPRLHQLPIFHQIAEKIKRPVSILAIFIHFVGAAVIVVGIFRFFEDYGPEKLTLFLGVIIIVLGNFLYLWARTSLPEKKTTYAKIVTLSFSAIMGLVYVMRGAAAIEFSKFW